MSSNVQRLPARLRPRFTGANVVSEGGNRIVIGRRHLIANRTEKVRADPTGILAHLRLGQKRLSGNTLSRRSISASAALLGLGYDSPPMVKPAFSRRSNCSVPTSSGSAPSEKTSTTESPITDKRTSARLGGLPFATGLRAASRGNRTAIAVTVGSRSGTITVRRIGLTSKREERSLAKSSDLSSSSAAAFVTKADGSRARIKGSVKREATYLCAEI